MPNNIYRYGRRNFLLGLSSMAITSCLGNSNNQDSFTILEEGDWQLDNNTTPKIDRVQPDFLAIDQDSPLHSSKIDQLPYYNSCQKDTIHIGSQNSRTYTAGSYHSSVWTSSEFNGNFCRQIIGDSKLLKVNLEAKTGGFDTAMIRVNQPIRVDDVDSQSRSSSTINVALNGPGQWWVGPKLAIKEDVSQNLHNNYENYVVENASRSPSGYHRRLSYMGNFLGQTVHNGSIYKHYYNEHSTWGQFWAIRQNYRTTGLVSLKPILNMWRNNGLPNEYISSVRTNVETDGKLTGTVEMSNINTLIL